MVDSILDTLETIGYTGPFLDEENRLELAVKNGLNDNLFINFIIQLTSEIKNLLSLNETVTRPSGSEDQETFNLEMRSFLKELQCQHLTLLQDLAALNQPGNRIILIDYLLNELMTARLLKCKSDDSSESRKNNFEANPYDIHSNLAAILKVYDINTPPPHVTPTMVLDKIITKTKDVVASAPVGHLSPPLVLQPLTAEQWGTLDRINDSLTKEYSTRRQMLLTRCTVTVQSFKWSDKTKGKDDVFTSVYQRKWSAMKEKAIIPIARVLAAKQDLLNIERTNNPTVRQYTRCDVNKVLIGAVPDRGGRPNETRPPPEMPGFKQRTEPPKERREGGGGKGGRGGRGGRVQGGWSSHDKGGGGYQRSYSTGDNYQQQQQGGGWEGGVVYDGRDHGGYYERQGSFGGYQQQGGYYDNTHHRGGGGGGGKRGQRGRGNFQHQYSSYY